MDLDKFQQTTHVIRPPIPRGKFKNRSKKFFLEYLNKEITNINFANLGTLHNFLIKQKI